MTHTKTQPSTILPAFMSVPEFARYAGLGRSSIYELFARREIATVKIGRRRLVPVASAQAWRDNVIAGALSSSTEGGHS